MRAGKWVMVVLAVAGVVWSTVALAQRGGRGGGGGARGGGFAGGGGAAADTGAAWVVPPTTLRAAASGVRRRSHPMAERWPPVRAPPPGRGRSPQHGDGGRPPRRHGPDRFEVRFVHDAKGCDDQLRGGRSRGHGAGGVQGGRYVGGVQVTGPGGQTYSQVGRGGAAVGPQGNAVGGRSSVSAATGPAGSAVGASRSGTAVGPSGAVSGGYHGGVAVGPQGAVAGGSRGSRRPALGEPSPPVPGAVWRWVLKGPWPEGRAVRLLPDRAAPRRSVRVPESPPGPAAPSRPGHAG